MKLGVLKESHLHERRVAVTPETAAKLQSLGFTILVESKAGSNASFSDSSYQENSCQICSAEKILSESDLIVKIHPPNESECASLKDGQTWISLIWPHQNKELLEKLQKKSVTILAMDTIPRITRAQKMDVLSSMANIAGYRAVIEAAHLFGSFFTGQMTAAGKVSPARVLVIGAGVAGLAAIGTAHGLGAIVRAFDTRPAVRDQVKSMGAEFLEISIEEDGSGEGGYAKVMSKEFIEAEMQLFSEQAKEVDIIITTALVPGKKAPVLITEEMVQSMKPGSVIVDLAAEQGGNCALTQKDQVVTHNHVSLIGYTDLPSRLSPVASTLYSNNIYHFLDELGGAANFNLDLDNEVIRGALILHQGKMMWPPPPLSTPKPQTTDQSKNSESIKEEEKKSLSQKKSNPFWLLTSGALLLAVGWFGSSDFLNHLTVFVLSCVIGWQVIWSVTPALHTPLMSVTNAISGIIIIGGLVQATGAQLSAATWLGLFAIFVATINIAGGFLVTSRMLKMFRRDS